jgi:hypothetical protein
MFMMRVGGLNNRNLSHRTGIRRGFQPKTSSANIPFTTEEKKACNNSANDRSAHDSANRIACFTFRGKEWER